MNDRNGNALAVGDRVEVWLYREVYFAVVVDLQDATALVDGAIVGERWCDSGIITKLPSSPAPDLAALAAAMELRANEAAMVASSEEKDFVKYETYAAMAKTYRDCAAMVRAAGKAGGA